ncbi:sensor histidine kinase [Acidovorax sp.]|uniref:sensor histidine kinase n=1 Tax=Acidovorax sp. TaxID=1872122 RepID=UPI00391A4D30
MNIDWIAKLRHLLQMTAFCLVIAAIHYAFRPHKPYEIPLVYSLAIGLPSWVLIDFGRHFFPSSRDTGWPEGFSGIALPLVGNVLGFVVGTWFADRWFGFSSWNLADRSQLRISIGITVLSALAMTYFFYSRGKSAWLQAKMTEMRSQASEAQLKLLETQLEPHMLFNTLANLRVLISTDPVRAQEMLDRIIAYLRATLSASRSTLHPLASEFDRLRDYLELMAVRMGPRMAYTLELPDALQDVPVPPLLLQPLVENAIRHGLEPQVQGGHITVRASTRSGPQGPMLVIEVNDTGAGLPATLPTPGPGQSFGLAQVRERLATLHGSQGTLELIAASAGGTSARVTFPLDSSQP